MTSADFEFFSVIVCLQPAHKTLVGRRWTRFITRNSSFTRPDLAAPRLFCTFGIGTMISTRKVSGDYPSSMPFRCLQKPEDIADDSPATWRAPRRRRWPLKTLWSRLRGCTAETERPSSGGVGGWRRGSRRLIELTHNVPMPRTFMSLFRRLRKRPSFRVGGARTECGASAVGGWRERAALRSPLLPLSSRRACLRSK